MRHFIKTKTFLFVTLFLSCAIVNTPSVYASPPDVKAIQGHENPPDIAPTYNLPAYEKDAIKSIGQMQHYTVNEEDTLLDIARHFNLGFVEMRAANPSTDPWLLNPGQNVLLPNFHILPRAVQKGIVINLSEMRLYHFYDKEKPPVTYPIGIGRSGLNTPQGKTTIIRKKDGPSWTPTKRMREEKPDLPQTVPAGPLNPLGTHALYLGWPTFLIHGTNKPWGIGRRVSSGCIRLYPENIAELFKQTPVDTSVEIVDQPVKLAWIKDSLYLEVHPNAKYSNKIELNGLERKDEKESILPSDLKTFIIRTAGKFSPYIDWTYVTETFAQQNGYPHIIIKDRMAIEIAMKAAKSRQQKTAPDNKIKSRDFVFQE